jgi:LysM repeat protein
MEESNLNPPPLDYSSNANLSLDAVNPPMSEPTNLTTTLPPTVTNLSVPVPPIVPVEPVVPTVGSEYKVVSGDSLAKIAKNHGVTLKELQAANPSVIPTKLKIGQKLTIPAGGSAAASSVAPAFAVGETSAASYTVISGDSLTKIAKAHGTTVKAIEAANGLTTTKIKVGQKLKIPSKVAVAPVAPAPVPVVEPTPAPSLPPISTPAPFTPAPAPGR